ncbi:MAG: hypothetical protein AAB297_07050 [Acidobacteriota bacterium]
MSGEALPPASPAPPEAGLPPLVLHCRPWPRNLGIALAVCFLLSGTAVVARPAARPDSGPTFPWQGAGILLAGACSACYAGRYCLSRLVLDEIGFRLEGPLVERGVRWSEVLEWKRLPSIGGPTPIVLLVYGPARRRLFIPLIYEESQALLVGLEQHGFPRY